MGDLHSSSRIALQSYIEQARELSIYGGKTGWLTNKWVTTTLRNPIKMEFCEMRRHSSEAIVPLKSPFLEFAKAYVRHRQHRKEVGSIASTMSALRFIYAALVEIHSEPDVSKIDGAIQELVREKIAAWYSDDSNSPYLVGGHLMAIYATLRDNGIHPALPYWQSPWKEKVNKAYSMSPKAKAWRKEKTPDDQKLAAVLVAFELAESDKDQYYSSLALLLAFAPSRGGELIDLGVKSLIDETFTNRYGRVKRRVGVRWFSEKGFGARTSWVPRISTSNGDEAQETFLMDKVVLAFNRLKRLSEPARRVAKLAFDTQGSVYPIHEFCITSADYSQTQVLSDPETAHAMGRTATLTQSNLNIGKCWRTKKYFGWHTPCIERGNPTYRDIAQADYEHFTGKFPFWPHTSNSERIKVWDCLVLRQWSQFNEGGKRVYPNSYMLPSTAELCIQLSGKCRKGKTQTSLFQRLGLTLEDGSAIQLQSHDFRRWHGTRGRELAHKGLTEHRLRMLAGRQDITQNEAYDFTTPKQRAERFRQIMAKSSESIPLHERVTIGTPIYRHELLDRKLGELEVLQPVQLGEYGGCTHSITEPPCMKGGDCLTCSEKKYIKGMPGCLERLRETAAHHKAEFDALEAWQKKRDQLGVDQWMTYNAIRYAVAESLVRQMEDPTIPDGTVLGVDEKFDPSPLKVNLMAKGIDVPEQPEDLVSQEINQLLGFD